MFAEEQAEVARGLQRTAIGPTVLLFRSRKGFFVQFPKHGRVRLPGEKYGEIESDGESHAGSGLQNEYLSANWTCRLSAAVPVMRPKVPVPSEAPGLPNCGVLNALNISARNSSRVSFTVRHAKSLRSRQVEGVQAGSDDRIARRSAVGRAAGEGVGIEPARRSPVVEHRRLAGDQVGTGPQRVVIPGVAALNDIDRETAGQRNHTAHRPAAGHAGPTRG